MVLQGDSERRCGNGNAEEGRKSKESEESPYFLGMLDQSGKAPCCALDIGRPRGCAAPVLFAFGRARSFATSPYIGRDTHSNTVLLLRM